MRVACLGDPLPRVGAQNIVELCEELACIYYKHAEITVRVAFLVSSFELLSQTTCVLRHKNEANLNRRKLNSNQS